MKKWFSGLRIKLLTIGFIPIIGMAVISLLGFKSVENLTDSIHNAYEKRIPLTELSSEISTETNTLFRYLLNSIIIKNNVELRKKYISQSRSELELLDKNLKKYYEVTISPKARKILDEKFLPNWEKIKVAISELLIELEKNTEDGNTAAEQILGSKIRPFSMPLNSYLDELKTIRAEINLKNQNEAYDLATRNKNIMVMISVVLTLISLCIAIYNILNLIKALSNLVTNLHNSSDEVTTVATQIAATSEELSQSATEQASSLEQTVAAVEQMSSMIKRNSENANHTAQNSDHSNNTAIKGQQAIKNMLIAVQDVNHSNDKIMNQINESNERISEITTIISNIADKTKVINEIVFQTKLLAFNASVEAARAGDHGKGFSVVAEEVGNLAQMSGNAAKEIADMLSSSIEKVQSTVNDTKTKVHSLASEGKEKISNGLQVANVCDDSLQEITKCVQVVTTLAAEISQASHEQSKGIEEINKAMKQLDQMTQMNAASSQQSSTAAHQLSKQAIDLKKEVNDLVELIEGNKPKKLDKYNEVG